MKRTMFDGIYRAGKLSIGVIMTGGTIAKTYDPREAKLSNTKTRVRDLIQSLRLEDMTFEFLDLMHKDSLDIGPDERQHIVKGVQKLMMSSDALLISHGTDSMTETGEALIKELGVPPIPIILTGAMVPFSVEGSDAVQNVSEALLAARLLPIGIYIVLHNRILPLPGVRKDYGNLTFEACGSQ